MGLFEEKRQHEGPVVVTCPTCGKTQVLTEAQRNNPKSGGVICDGEYGRRGELRHRATVMLGPEGKHHA